MGGLDQYSEQLAQARSFRWEPSCSALPVCTEFDTDTPEGRMVLCPGMAFRPMDTPMEFLLALAECVVSHLT
jgi:hypothetical protein